MKTGEGEWGPGKNENCGGTMGAREKWGPGRDCGDTGKMGPVEIPWGPNMKTWGPNNALSRE